MSLTRVQVAALVAELQGLQGSKIGSIQAIAPSSFIFQTNGKRLLICLQQPFLRFHLCSLNYPEYATPFTKALSETLRNCAIGSILQLNDDRILEIQAGSYRLIAELFAKRPNLYLTDGQRQILVAFHPVPKTHYTLPAKPPCPMDTSAGFINSLEVELLYALREKKQQLQKFINQRLKRNLKTEQACQEDLSRGLLWQQAQHEAELLQSNFFQLKRGLDQVEVLDWVTDESRTISLDSSLEPIDEVARRFKQAKKLRLSIEPLKQQIEVLYRERSRLENVQKSLSDASSLEELFQIESLARFPNPGLAKEREKTLALPYREFLTSSGLKIWAGKDAKGNDKLTFSHAKGSDWWLHVHNFPGSHVVLKVGKQQLPDEESIQDAIQVALAYSRAKEQRAAEVCVTQVKYVSRLGKGKAGKVQVSKHKIMQASFDQERFHQIKMRSRQASLDH